mgnify:FL=1|tara:strand:+ start:503 stop:823 length:321 start_codon:yes stop_codon:yes gene_type:complete
METKEMLEATIAGLQEKVEQITKDLQMKQAELEDVNKPELSKEQFDIISDAIRNGIYNTSFEEDNFDWEPEFCGKEVQMNYMTFEGQDCLHENIEEKIQNEFKIVE